MGSAVGCGICHTFSADGRCISLLKVLYTNACSFDCAYCCNRRSADVPRATFTPRELCELTMGFYRRNYIEGLFLSSAVLQSPDYTSELLIKALRMLREEYRFNGYIHVKAIPGADTRLLESLGLLADRMSVNIELPSEKSLTALAPNKTRQSILRPMGFIRDAHRESKAALTVYKNAPRFAPAGQGTQLIVGATHESDLQILRLSESLYNTYALRRVFYSAYVPVVSHALLPAQDCKPPLLREHRLYQADWLLRFYNFNAAELLDEANPFFNPLLDPKCNWAVNHPERFPLEVNKASREDLLRVPGVGVRSADRIVTARRAGPLDFDALRRLGVVLKRAQYFLLCKGKRPEGLHPTPQGMLRALTTHLPDPGRQLTLFDAPLTQADIAASLTGEL